MLAASAQGLLTEVNLASGRPVPTRELSSASQAAWPSWAPEQGGWGHTCLLGVVTLVFWDGGTRVFLAGAHVSSLGEGTRGFLAWPHAAVYGAVARGGAAQGFGSPLAASSLLLGSPALGASLRRASCTRRCYKSPTRRSGLWALRMAASRCGTSFAVNTCTTSRDTPRPSPVWR